MLSDEIDNLARDLGAALLHTILNIDVVIICITPAVTAPYAGCA